MTDIEWEHFHYFAVPSEYQVAVSPRPYVAYEVRGFGIHTAGSRQDLEKKQKFKTRFLNQEDRESAL